MLSKEWKYMDCIIFSKVSVFVHTPIATPMATRMPCLDLVETDTAKMVMECHTMEICLPADAKYSPQLVFSQFNMHSPSCHVG